MGVFDDANIDFKDDDDDDDDDKEATLVVVEETDTKGKDTAAECASVGAGGVITTMERGKDGAGASCVEGRNP